MEFRKLEFYCIRFLSEERLKFTKRRGTFSSLLTVVKVCNNFQFYILYQTSYQKFLNLKQFCKHIYYRKYLQTSLRVHRGRGLGRWPAWLPFWSTESEKTCYHMRRSCCGASWPPSVKRTTTTSLANMPWRSSPE